MLCRNYVARNRLARLLGKWSRAAPVSQSTEGFILDSLALLQPAPGQRTSTCRLDFEQQQRDCQKRIDETKRAHTAATASTMVISSRRRPNPIRGKLFPPKTLRQLSLCSCDAQINFLLLALLLRVPLSLLFLHPPSQPAERNRILGSDHMLRLSVSDVTR